MLAQKEKSPQLLQLLTSCFYVHKHPLDKHSFIPHPSALQRRNNGCAYQGQLWMKALGKVGNPCWVCLLHIYTMCVGQKATLGSLSSPATLWDPNMTWVIRPVYKHLCH